jgi:hypothetical protein
VPRKIFVAGEILTAADLQSNAVDQSVMVFNDATARDTAIPSPIEGMVVYLKDTDGLLSYSGTAWVPAASGASLGAGSILQVVTGVKTDTQSSSVATGATAAIIGLFASITPRATSSKVLVMYDISGSAGGTGYSIILERNGTPISLGAADGSRTQVTSGGNPNLGSPRPLTVSSAMVLDSPNTTSPILYEFYIQNSSGSTQSLFVNRSVDDNNNSSGGRAASRVTLMEVAG